MHDAAIDPEDQSNMRASRQQFYIQRAMQAHLAGELGEHAHRRPVQLAKRLPVAVLTRRKVDGGHILVAVVDVIHTVRSRHHMLRPNQRPCALQAPAPNQMQIRNHRFGMLPLI